MKKIFVALFGLVLAGNVCLADETMELKDEQDRLNYSIGYQIGSEAKQVDIAVREDLLLQGVQDALQGARTVSTEKMRSALFEMKTKVIVAQEKILSKDQNAAESGKTQETGTE